MSVKAKWDVIIIGAGAAGLMCASAAGRRGRSVLVLDHSGKTGRKVLVSGGGKCNFTNLNVSGNAYLSNNAHFCKSALARFTPGDFMERLERHGLGWYEKEQGQLFCPDGAGAIAAMLGKDCLDSGVEILLNRRIGEINKNAGFEVSTNPGGFRAEALVVATGGLSYPKLGASGLGYEIAKSFGLNVTPLKPALVPLTLSPADLRVLGDLSGVSLGVEVRCGRRSFRGAMLFTHRGLSGPAILQTSLYWEEGCAITIDLLPDTDALEVLTEERQAKTELKNVLARHMPKRLANGLCEAYLKSKPMKQYNDKELGVIAQFLHNWELRPAGTEGYGIAEVTAGGVDTAELSSKTMEAVKVPGLYFIGEVVDVTGQLGGYNLHWAWASGHAAGQHV